MGVLESHGFFIRNIQKSGNPVLGFAKCTQNSAVDDTEGSYSMCGLLTS